MRLLDPFKTIIVAVALAGFFAVGVSEADAKSRQCRNLEARLASLKSGGGNPTRYRKYTRALAEQKRQIRKAARQARYIGCSATYGSRRVFTDAPGCRSLFATMDRMHRNLGKLERGVARYRPRGGSKRERSRLLAAINANGCRTVAKKKPKKPKQVAAVERPVDKQRAETIERILNDEQRPAEAEDQARAGSYRTMCVRTCDGYYFPVSFAATSSDFNRDERSCRAMCPGIDVALYHHKAVGEEPEDMVSLSGKPYSELPTAFKYRKLNVAKAPGCTCKGRKDFSIVGGDDKPAPGSVPTPVARPGDELPVKQPKTETASVPAEEEQQPEDDAPDAAKKEKSIIFRAPGSAPEPEEKKAAKEPENQASSRSDDSADTDDKKVRVVGPTFLPAQDAPSELPVPVPRP